MRCTSASPMVKRGAGSTPSGVLSTTASRSVVPGQWRKTLTGTCAICSSEHGPTYSHHTGHGIGAAWSQEPRITPYNDLRIEEGMVLALEPAIYEQGWGGIRLEHVFLVGASDNEILTHFEHTL